MFSCNILQYKMKSGTANSAKFISWLYGKNKVTAMSKLLIELHILHASGAGRTVAEWIIEALSTIKVQYA